MEKFEYIDEENKVCIVVLKNRFGTTIAKGISRCSEDDTFDKEQGIKLASARAWKKYFDIAIKECERHIAGAKYCISRWEEDITKESGNLAILQGKKADLEKELEELLSNL